ncbi:MAG: PLP-dependent aminotransferase family protein [Ilumatobacteraceae bacterium]
MHGRRPYGHTGPVGRSSGTSIERTTRGLEVDASVAGVARGRRGAHVAGVLRSAVVDGRLAPGTALPSTRRLADDLGVSRGLVVEVYAQLVAEGHLVAIPGSGTCVAPRPSPPPPPGPVVAPRRFVVDNPGHPDPRLFPRQEWGRALTAALRELPDHQLSYGDPRGLAELRAALASYLGRVRSINIRPDQVVVVNGFSQALVCITRHLTHHSRDVVIAVEDPGSIGTVETLQAWGASVVGIPVDGDGLDVGALETSGASAIVVTPAHQYPTGVTLGAERRHGIVDWAQRHDALILEDDYDAEYRYDRAPLTSLHALDPQRVVPAGSTSKSLSPALRLGWIVAPTHLADHLTDIKAAIDLGAPTLPQAALARLITSGALDRHIRRTRTHYRRRRDALVNTLSDHAAGIRIGGIAAGLHVLIHLDRHHTENDIADHARRLGLDAQPLSRYRHHAAGPAGLVLGYAARTPEQLRHAAALLAMAL